MLNLFTERNSKNINQMELWSNPWQTWNYQKNILRLRRVMNVSGTPSQRANLITFNQRSEFMSFFIRDRKITQHIWLEEFRLWKCFTSSRGERTVREIVTSPLQVTKKLSVKFSISAD